MQEQLLSWFKKHKKPYPWRVEPRDPYRVWVSEIMLQQTRIPTVLDYFPRFIQAFPTVQDLAKAPMEKVLKAWEGLGYYRRAHFLHQGAKKIVEKGTFPQTAKEWRAISGVGEYTAAILASLCFGEKVWALDGNALRIISRWFCLEDQKRKKVEHALSQVMEPSGEANEALMEFGQQLCLPKTPQCSLCPVKNHCCAFQKKKVALYPPKKVKKNVPNFVRYGGIYLKENKIFLQKRKGELLKGLWGIPLEEKPMKGKKKKAVHHGYSHFSLTVYPIVAEGEVPYGEGEWVEWEKVKELPLSRLDHKILHQLDNDD